MFPNLNSYSTPLLILVLQALIFAVLLLLRYRKTANLSDLLLGSILLLTSYSQICYTVGFMGWYDTFRNTKINYFLFNIGVALAPLIYLYVKSVTRSHFRLHKADRWHFVLSAAIILYRMGIYLYDALQPGFSDTQNGYLKINLDEAYVLPIMGYVEFVIMLLYLAFTLQHLYHYRKKIQQYFSNTYKLELNWILSFLLLFSLLFLYDSIQTVISQYIDLHYRQRWWLNLLTAIITLYMGIRGYFTDTTKLNKLEFSFSPNRKSIPEAEDIEEFDTVISDEEVAKVERLMEVEKAYLNPELNLSDLAKQAQMSRAQLSEIINMAFEQNFNEFVNSYRVEAFKGMLREGKHERLSLLGVAFECGFNSKATFNRVFKKLTSCSPTQYLKSL